MSNIFWKDIVQRWWLDLETYVIFVHSKFKEVYFMIGIYVRVSSEEQKKFGFSIGGQIERNVKFCEVNFPDEKYSFYIDKGISASKMKKRKRFKAMINAIEKEEISKIVCTDFDRLHRDLILAEKFWSFLEKNNVQLFCVDNGISRETPEEILFSRIKSSMSEFEIQKTSERTINCIVAAFNSGKIATGGKPPFGFVRKKGKFYIIKPQREIILEICKLYTETALSIQAIIDFIKEKHKIKLHPETINRILTSDIYRGKYHYRGNDYPIPIMINDVALQKRIDLRKKANYKAKTNLYLFNKKLICSSCGSTLKNDCTNKKNKTYLYYECHNKDCNDYMKRINQDKVIMKLYRELHEVFDKALDYEYDQDFHLKSLSELIKQKERKLRKLTDSFLDEIVEKYIYLKLKNRIEKELEKLTNEYNSSLESVNFNNRLKILAIEKYLPITPVKL